MNQPSATQASARYDGSRCFTDRTAIRVARYEICKAIERAKCKPRTHVRIVTPFFPDEIHWRECTKCKRPTELNTRDDRCRACNAPTTPQTWRRQIEAPPVAQSSIVDEHVGVYDEVRTPTPWTCVPDGAYQISGGRILRRRDA